MGLAELHQISQAQFKKRKKERNHTHYWLSPTALGSEVGTHLRVLGSELVQYVGGIKASVVTELAGNDLEGFSVSTYQQLLLAWNGPGVVPEVFGKLHLYRTTTGNNRVVLKEEGKLSLSFQEGSEQEIRLFCVCCT